MQAHQQYAQAIVLACRFNSLTSQQLLVACRQCLDISPALSSKLPALLKPVPPITWVMGSLPEPPLPVLVAAAPAAASSAADVVSTAGTKNMSDRKGTASGTAAGGKAVPAADKRPAVVVSKASKQSVPGSPRAALRQLMVPCLAKPHMGLMLR